VWWKKRGGVALVAGLTPSSNCLENNFYFHMVKSTKQNTQLGFSVEKRKIEKVKEKI